MNAANFPRFVSAGEALTDMLRTGADTWSSQVGGSTWNVARVMARLGVPSAFAGAVSLDVFGDALAAATAAAGLDMRFLQRRAKSPLLAIVHELHPPTYYFIGDDSADLHFDAAQLPAGWMQGAQWVHFGGISLAREPLAGKLVALAQELKAAGVKISYDPNFRVMMDERYDATLRRMVELADVVKVSDEDLAGLFRHDDIDGAFAVLRGWNRRATYLYTRGAQGAARHRGGRLGGRGRRQHRRLAVQPDVPARGRWWPALALRCRGRGGRLSCGRRRTAVGGAGGIVAGAHYIGLMWVACAY